MHLYAFLKLSSQCRACIGEGRSAAGRVINRVPGSESGAASARELDKAIDGVSAIDGAPTVVKFKMKGLSLWEFLQQLLARWCSWYTRCEGMLSSSV